ncbi:ATPdependent RNA helicase, partial [Cymbomonas tetramitiformis]
MAFWKPGAKKPEKPLSYDVDRGEDAGTTMAQNCFASQNINSQRERLPVAKVRDEFLYLVETHATTIIVGQTGCGKTTQLPQFLSEAGWASNGRTVACTQPRRIAAQSVAVRVADEMRCQLGQAVGYSIRFENVSIAGVTRIKYLTDSTLIREMMSDPLLTRYSVIMVDEAHERGLHTDVLLGLLKKVPALPRSNWPPRCPLSLKSLSGGSNIDAAGVRYDKAKMVTDRPPGVLDMMGTDKLTTTLQ